MKYIKIIIPIALIAVGAFFAFNQLKTNKSIIDEKAQEKEVIISQIPVKVATVSNDEMDNSLNLNGTFEARKELKVIAESQGRITSLYIKEGQQISRGQTVAKIDDASIRAQMLTANASLAKSRKDVERYENLLKAGAISQQQYEEVKLGMQNAQANLTAIEQQLKYTIVKSPMSGIVKEVELEEGSFANPGLTIATVVDVSRLKMIVKVPELDIVKVKRGQKVEIVTDVYLDKTFNGKVSQISVQADAGRKYEIEIDLQNSGKFPLKAGMYGEAKIPTSNKTEMALTIPRKSVVGSIQQPKVYLAVNEVAKLINVEVGEIIDDKIIILNGLKEGDKVITTGQINLEDGKKVKIMEQTIDN